MNLYLITRSQASHDRTMWYDTYDGAVVAAENEEAAKLTHPSDNSTPWNGKPDDSWPASVEEVSAQLIGVAAESIEAGVICASFHSA